MGVGSSRRHGAAARLTESRLEPLLTLLPVPSLRYMYLYGEN